MIFASFRASPSAHLAGGYRPGSNRQRAISGVLSILILLLIVIAAVVQMDILPTTPGPRTNLTTFDVSGDKQAATTRQTPTKQKEREQRRVPERAVREEPRTPTPQPTPREAEQPAFTFLKMSRQDLASADIAGMAKSGGAPDQSRDSGKAGYGPGEGPGGAILYNADWYRRPTDAQLGGYLPAKAPPQGWGMIACQTVEHFEVENCQILGESPQGSGFGKAVLDAAWQFRVIPPKLNGKPQLGSWVRIRIDYGVRAAG